MFNLHSFAAMRTADAPMEPGTEPALVCVTAEDSKQLQKLASHTLKSVEWSLYLKLLASVVMTALLVQSALSIASGDVALQFRAFDGAPGIPRELRVQNRWNAVEPISDLPIQADQKLADYVCSGE